MNPLAHIGNITIRFFASCGRLFLFVLSGIRAVFLPPYYLRLIGIQALQIGYYSLPVVALTCFFTGGVFALQIYYGSNQFNSESIIATIVALGITRELGPVFGGLMVAARVSSAIAAEIGTMRVSEQLDALTTLSTDPMKYLVAPRLIAAVLCLPILATFADTIGILGGFVVGTKSLDFTAATYLQQTYNFLDLDDILSGLIKASVFGFLIALMGCYHGYYCSGGAQGVGRATTNAAVSSAILILTSNYLMTSLLFSS